MTRRQAVRVFTQESGFPQAMAEEIIWRILTDARRPIILNRLQKKLERHPIFSKARVWLWVAPGNVPDPIALAVVSAGIQKAELILKLSRHNERTGRALVRILKKPGQTIRIITNHRDLKKYSVRAAARVIYGSDTTIQKLAKQAPRAAELLTHGHRISLSIVFRSALTRGLYPTVKKCARDIWLYDQRGCLSPQIIWVEREAGSFAAALHEELAHLRQRHGVIRRSAELDQIRRSAIEELRVRSLGPRDLILLGSDPAVYLLNKGRFSNPASGQIIAVKSFNAIGDVLKGIKPFLRHLQGIAVAGNSAESRRVKKAFVSTTARYFMPIGLLQNPPLDWQT